MSNICNKRFEGETSLCTKQLWQKKERWSANDETFHDFLVGLCCAGATCVHLHLFNGGPSMNYLMQNDACAKPIVCTRDLFHHNLLGARVYVFCMWYACANE